MACAFSSLKLYPCFRHHRQYLFTNDFRGRSETHSQCQKTPLQNPPTSHFHLHGPGLTNRDLHLGRSCQQEIRLFFNTVCTRNTVGTSDNGFFSNSRVFSSETYLGKSKPAVKPWFASFTASFRSVLTRLRSLFPQPCTSFALTTET